MENNAKIPYSNRDFDAQFLSIVPYNDPLILDGIAVSVDGVRLRYSYSKTFYDFEAHTRMDALDYISERLNSVSMWLTSDFDLRVTEYAFRIGYYMRTFTFTLLDGNSFAVLVGRYCTDASVKQIAPEVVMDFNPNKIPSKTWQRIAYVLAPGAVNISVQRFDLAIDLPVERGQLQLLQRPGSGYQKFVDKRGAITEYTGERSHHAAVKLYDKGAELEVGITCTRIEITIDPDRYKSISALFPKILSYAPVALNLDFSSLPFEVQAVILHPDLYEILKSSVNRNTFARYKRMIQNYGQTYFTLSNDQFARIDHYIRDYSVKLTTVGTFQCQ